MSAATEYGAVVSVPAEKPSTKNSTLITVTGAATAATALRTYGLPTAADWPLVGLVKLTVRGFSRLVMMFVPELACWVVGLESVALTKMLCVPTGNIPACTVNGSAVKVLTSWSLV